MRIRNYKLYKSWCLYAEPHGLGFFGGNWLLLPTIGIYKLKGYLQLSVGWLKWSYSITFFNCL